MVMPSGFRFVSRREGSPLRRGNHRELSILPGPRRGFRLNVNEFKKAVDGFTAFTATETEAQGQSAQPASKPSQT